ncbi:hypothetical protein SeGA_5100 [Salmonella enterica subsp. enterica serovar Gaminara str. A4-567]|nr:hypothetical protein SeGA_5100 [Salmonella enterica subsp. enterica serovar Gaminara str. A4-567]EHC65754.1 hypothetical protein LTSEMIS_5057 [Salmonella enterica subsp. enterica serovar Mississippi str. A4-633]
MLSVGVEVRQKWEGGFSLRLHFLAWQNSVCSEHSFIS